MATSTQYNPNAEFNATLLANGASKTVYALVTPETEHVKNVVFGSMAKLTGTMDAQRVAYLEQFRDAWTGKQDAYHTAFFDTWHQWSAPLVDLDRSLYPFAYPTAGASEPLRHIIFDYAARARRYSLDRPEINVFKGEYEGYKAMAEAAGIGVREWDRQDWLMAARYLTSGRHTLFFLSQPSAIDGNVWKDAEEFLIAVDEHTAVIDGQPNSQVIMDMTYVGAIPERSTKFNLNHPCIRNVVFSLSKPFGAYYDRIGGVFCREEDLGLFGNKWFKGLTALNLGTALMNAYDVFYMAGAYRTLQLKRVLEVNKALDLDLKPSDVYMLASGPTQEGDFSRYLERAGKIRVCLTPGMADEIGTSGAIRQ